MQIRMTSIISAAALAFVVATAQPAEAQRYQPYPPGAYPYTPQRTYVPPSTYRNPFTNEAMQNRGRVCPEPYRNPYTNEAMQQRRTRAYDPYWCLRRVPYGRRY